MVRLLQGEYLVPLIEDHIFMTNNLLKSFLKFRKTVKIVIINDYIINKIYFNIML